MNIVICLFSALASAAVARYYLHMLQLESYQLDGYIRWLSKNHDKQFGPTLTIGVGATLIYYALWLLLRVFLSASAAPVATNRCALSGTMRCSSSRVSVR